MACRRRDRRAAVASVDWKNPGGKEYLIAGGLALGAWFLYRRLSGKTAASTAGTAGGQVATPTGLSTETLTLWIKDHAGTGGKKPSPDPGGGKKKKKGGKG